MPTVWKNAVMAALACVMLSACAATRPALEGAWECVEPAPVPGEVAAVKVLSDGHFAFGRPSPAGDTVFAGGGTYVYQDRTYTETVAWHWAPKLVGQTIVFDCSMKDGLWYHRATFEAGGERFEINEIWRRVGEPKPGPAE